jgi:uncharacterized iron-regulated protein
MPTWHDFGRHWLSAAAIGAAFLTGCQSGQRSTADREAALARWQQGEAAAQPIATITVFDGRSGEQVKHGIWTDLAGRIAQADVVIVGEQHDDAVGHAVELRITQLVVQDRGGSAALSMEMLERDEQPAVNDYLDDLIDVEAFVKLTESADWAGKGSWATWYQPMIDEAKVSGARVIAANTPRRYVRVARRDGYDRLESLDPQRQALFDVPIGSLEGPYRDRFMELMSAPMPPSPPEGGGNKAAHANPHAGAPASEQLDSSFRSQMLWDATMAASIDRALDHDVNKIVHVVGQFHSDFEGGTVQQLRARRPDVKILTISLQPVEATSLREEDRDRADVVIYTGPRVKDE